jgi:hypothetical protein
VSSTPSTSSTTNAKQYDFPNTATVTNDSLGLTFSLALNSTQIFRGQTVNLTVFVTDDRSTPNNVTQAYNWAETWFIGWSAIDSCNSFANAQVFQGYYTQSNISAISNGSGPYGLQLAKRLSLPLECPFVPGSWSTYFPFQPNQSRIGYQYSAHGYYGSSPLDSAFKVFDPGVYTVAAGDEWG